MEKRSKKPALAPHNFCISTLFWDSEEEKEKVVSRADIEVLEYNSDFHAVENCFSSPSI